MRRVTCLTRVIKQPLISQTYAQRFSQTDQMIELCCEYLSAQ